MPMKTFFKSLGKASLYFIAFFVIQMIASGFYFTLVSLYYMWQNAGMIQADPSQAMQLIQEFIADSMGSHLAGSILFADSVAVLFVWLFFLIRKKKIFHEIGLTKCSGKNIIAAVLFGAGISIVLGFVTDLLPFSEQMQESFQQNQAMLPSENTWINLLAIAFVGPIAEEVFFRGLVYTRLKAGMPVIVAAIISSALFGIVHGGLIWFVTAFLAGLALVWVFETTKSLYASIAVHIANNTVAQLTQSLSDTSDWISYLILAVCFVLFAGSAVYLAKANPGVWTKHKESSDTQLP